MSFIDKTKNLIERLGTPKLVEVEGVPYVIAFSEIGNRKNNEDKYFYDVDKGIYAVADGMGEYEGGEFCSKFAVNTVVDEVKDVHAMLQKSVIEKEDITSYLEKIVEQINYSLNAMVKDKNVSFLVNKGGTTLDLMFIYDGTAYITHVGDGAVYLFNLEGEKYVEKITDEHHNYPEYTGKLSLIKKQIIGSKGGSTSYVGKGENMIIDSHTVNIGKNQLIGMFTDGVTKTVSPSEKLDIIVSNKLENIESAFIDRINNPVEMKRIVDNMDKEGYDVNLEKMKGDNATGIIYGVIPK